MRCAHTYRFVLAYRRLHRLKLPEPSYISFTMATSGDFVPLNLKVPAGQTAFTLEVRTKLAERGCYWRDVWQKEKSVKPLQFDRRRMRHIRAEPKWGYLARTIQENFPSLKDVHRDVSK